MIPWLTPSMIASWASGTLTFRRTWLRVAPNDSAASTVFASTLRTPFSTRRATTGKA